MFILSLDLSSKSTGYAVFENEKLVKSGRITASSTDVIKRIQKIVAEISTICNNYPIDTVVCEEVLPSVNHNSNTNVWKALTWLQATVMFYLHDNFPRVKKKFMLPNTWRSRIGIHTGRGVKREALKEADINFVKQKYNKLVNDDEADAICLGLAYISETENEMNWGE